MKYDNLTFWATNIPKDLEDLEKQLRNEIYKYVEVKDRAGYEIGVKNTISLLQQLLDNSIIDHYNPECEKAVVYYDPTVEISTEMDIKEVYEWACWA